MLSFLELGVTPGVEQEFLHPEDDHVSEAIIPDGSFPLTGTDHDSFHVSALLQHHSTPLSSMFVIVVSIVSVCLFSPNKVPCAQKLSPY